MAVNLGQRLAAVELADVQATLEDLVRRVGELRSAVAGDVVVDVRDRAAVEQEVTR